MMCLSCLFLTVGVLLVLVMDGESHTKSQDTMRRQGKKLIRIPQQI